MRILRLDLKAFGLFTDVQLDLALKRGAAKPAVHVIYGRNEAGKSTALRALTGLLFGIPERTRDAHLHPMPQLRIGATLLGEDGKRLEVVRRMGRKDTLLTRRGGTMDEARLAHLLAGVTRERFEALFGLDHETLRRGAEAILAGRGDVGQSLFDAGTGGRGVHEVLTGLEREADELFTSSARSRRLNEALEAFREARRAVAEGGLSADAWREQQRGLEEARGRRDSLAAERGELLRSRSRQQRDLRVFPLLARRADVLQCLERLGDGPDVPQDAGERRVETLAERGRRGREVSRLADELAKLVERRDALVVPESLVALSDDRVEELRDRLVRQRSAGNDRPRLDAELAAADDDARALLRQLGEDVSLGEAARLHLDAARQARVRTLAERKVTLVVDLRHARADLEERRREHDRLAAELASLPLARDVESLARLLDAGRGSRGEGERRRTRKRDLADAEDLLKSRLASLPSWSGTADEARTLAVPTLESVDRFAAAFADVDQTRRRLTDRAREQDSRRRAVLEELEAETRTGEVVTEQDLSSIRGERDRRWRALRARGRSGGPEGDAFEDLIARADELSDRLRREAGRVARHAELVAVLKGSEDEGAAVEAERATLEAHAVSLQAEWTELWAPAGQVPTEPPDMRGWLQRWTEVVSLAEQVSALRREVGDDERRVAELHRGLLTAFAAIGDEVDERVDATTLVERGARIVDGERERAAARTRLAADLRRLTVEIEGWQRRERENERALQGWTTEWARAVESLGLDEKATGEEAMEVLDVLARLTRKVDDVARLRRQMDAATREGEAFDKEVERLVTEHLPSARELPLDERVETLVRRHRQARSDEVRRAELDEDIATLSAAHDGQARHLALAEEALSKLLAEAGVGEVEELEAAEVRSVSARELRCRLTETEAQLLDAGDGADVATLLVDTRDADVDATRARLAEIEDRLEQVAEGFDEAVHDLGRIERGFEEQMRGGASVGDLAVRAQGHLADVRELTGRWVRTRLAASVLRREIERYREEHQGPILKRADVLFRKLTLGGYQGLRAGFDSSDRPVLKCVRRFGVEVDVDALSDGTRDQLYLALRVASLERLAESQPSMPFVLDDILIHLDDDGVVAALGVLSELADTTQVLFFTHHARLVELARRAVPQDRLFEHVLDGKLPKGLDAPAPGKRAALPADKADSQPAPTVLSASNALPEEPEAEEPEEVVAEEVVAEEVQPELWAAVATPASPAPAKPAGKSSARVGKRSSSPAKPVPKAVTKTAKKASVRESPARRSSAKKTATPKTAKKKTATAKAAKKKPVTAKAAKKKPVTAKAAKKKTTAKARTRKKTS